MRANPAILITCALLSLPGCGTHASYVGTTAALGRVIVYRNGIAYYERTAEVTGNELALRVPGDKVNDFLKSLTVVDVATGQALPVDFPQSGQVSADGNVAMTVRLPLPAAGAPATRRRVKLTYISEAPAWKPSYRAVVDDTGRVRLEGWAVVDNTSGEDWEQVRVGVGSSSALSFRFDLQSVRMINREMLEPQQLFAQAPPMGGSTHAANETVVLAQLEDAVLGGAVAVDDGRRRDSEALSARSPERQAKLSRRPASAASGAPADSAARETPSAASGLDNVARMLRGRGDRVVVEGFAEASERDGATRAAERAKALKDQLVQRGVPAAQIDVVARGAVAGQRGGARIVQAPATPAAASARAAAVDASQDPVGESHFESPVALTVRRGSSAMVSIINEATRGQVVYLYDPESSRGNQRFAFKAVRFENPTGSTLESGPMTVYGKERFVGEGMADPIPGHAVAVIPFALDRQVVIEQSESSADRIHSLQKAVRGVFTAEVKRTRKLALKLTNRLAQPTIVYVRHSVPAGYKLTSALTSERYGDAYLFPVELAASQTRSLLIEEETPIQRTLDMRTPETMGLLSLYLEAPSDDPALTQALKRLLKLHGEVGGSEEKIQSLREREAELRVRMDELHAQIVNLQMARTAGPLMTHLKSKLKEISEQVQAMTLKTVEEQERLMVTKVQLADGLAELHLESKAVASR